MVTVTLPDGSTLEVDDGATVEDVAYEIGEGLGDDTVAGVVDGELVAREHELHEDCEIEIVTADSDEYLDVLRHSAAHVFAQALQRLHPDAELTIGPWTDDGFYYDLANVDLDEDDLRAIEDEMRDIVDADLPIERVEVPRADAEEYYSDNAFKREILEDEASGEQVTFYEQGDFRDLCKGPHVASTGEVEAFELLDISGAYWRGDEDNEMLTRVHGTAFPSESELDEFLEMREKAQERDHRTIGEEMDLFSITPTTGPGLPLYHPNGKTILDELRDYITDLNAERGCEPVETPHLFKTELWKESGHYDNYQDDMFLFEVGDDELGLKPMNCPGHAMIFKHSAWSYRDLPVRYTEQGKVYRKEQRGELSGLSRVWAFTIDDGHLFVRPDQIDQEVEEILDNIFHVLDTFGLDHEVMLATKPEDKYVGGDEIWAEAESQLRDVLERNDIDYGLEEGEGAFYGPKIDFAFEDALGREWDGPTVQLDFNMPERFDLTYQTRDNEEERPVMIHRALYGSYERFLMVLIEHYDGRFPTWLAPEQVRVLPITDDNLDYAEAVAEELDGFRVEVEDRSWTVGKKIQAAHDDRVPYMLIVGDDEEHEGTVSVRDRQEREAGGIDIDEFRDALANEVDGKHEEPGIIS